MKLPRYVHKIPSSLNFPGKKGYIFALTGTIFFPQEYYDDLKSDNPSHHSISLLIHEEDHRNRRGFKSIKTYLIPKHHLEEELKAYRVQFAYLKKHSEKYDIERAARGLSSGLISLFMTDYKTAKMLLEKAWEEA